MSYSEKLKSPKWQKKRLEILNRDNFTCTCCGDKKTELHGHHLKYTKEPYDAPNEDLETLCKNCHLIKTIWSKSGVSTFILHGKKSIDKIIVYKLSDGSVFFIDFSEEIKPTDFRGFINKSETLRILYEFSIT